MNLDAQNKDKGHGRIGPFCVGAVKTKRANYPTT